MFEAKGVMVFYENMLALNNISIKCQEGQIVGIFGANSAGKSTLMYTLSGIMQDIKRKEEMAGGERITLMGEVFYRGVDIMALKPSQRARKGIILCPERRRIFPESTVLENLKMGGYLADSTQNQVYPGIRFQNFPGLGPFKKAGRRVFKRWRTTDAGHRPGLDGPAQNLVTRRTSHGSQSVGPGLTGPFDQEHS